ncbi:hypothetical protein D9M68_1005610 [compost metagenome]
MKLAIELEVGVSSSERCNQAGFDPRVLGDSSRAAYVALHKATNSASAELSLLLQRSFTTESGEICLLVAIIFNSGGNKLPADFRDSALALVAAR